MDPDDIGEAELVGTLPLNENNITTAQSVLVEDLGSITPTTAGKKETLDIQWIFLEKYLHSLKEWESTLLQETQENTVKLTELKKDFETLSLGVSDNALRKINDQNLIKSAHQYKKALQQAEATQEQKLIENPKNEQNLLDKSIKALSEIKEVHPCFSVKYQENIANTNEPNDITPVVTRYGINAIALKGLIGTTLKSDILHPIEAELFDFAFKELQAKQDAENYLKSIKDSQYTKYANNVVLMDMLVRDKGVIKADTKNPSIPETHTFAIWYKKANELNIIDPSNSTFSASLIGPMKEYLKELKPNIDVKEVKGIIYGSGNEPTGYTNYSVIPTKLRDCIDVAVKIGFEMTFSSQQAARYQKSFNWPECICL